MKVRSVHNIRIERLWVEVGRTIVAKWKPFFEALEARHGLRVDSAGHVWLLHHLFLRSLNGDVVEWAEHWNCHVMRLREQRDNAPRDMFMMGLRRRPLGDADMREEEAVEDLAHFGIDWEAVNDEDLVRHLMERAQNPFDDYAPDALNAVPCEPPECPLTLDQVEELDALLATEFNIDPAHMDGLTGVWIRALAWCRGLF